MSYSLYVCIDFPGSNDVVETQLNEIYIKAIQAYNSSASNIYRDSGFDIFVPSEIVHKSNDSMVSIDHGIKAVCMKELITNEYPCGYYMYPRSSISMSRYRLSNGVGIIDSGYRGNLIAKLDILPFNEENTIIAPYTKLFQLCTPDLSAFRKIVLVSKTHPLFNSETTRGTRCFESTNRF